jgi:hypothetical protein
MSALPQFLLLAAIEVAGLFAIWFLLRARVRRYLELENLLSGVREEARALVMELNETADRNVSLVEDRIVALHDLLDELDRRIGVERKILVTRDSEREVYAKLSKRRPIVPSEARSPERREFADALAPGPVPAQPQASASVPAPQEGPITLNLGSASAEPARSTPEIEVSERSVVPPRSKREEALDLHKRGFSADLIAARTGATVAEIELLVEIEERRSGARGSPS